MNKNLDVIAHAVTLIIKAAIRKRLADSLELALAQAGGMVTVLVLDQEPILFSEKSA